MFTGLVIGQGTLVRVLPGPGEARLVLRADAPLPDLRVGESIAVNGVCLTAESGSADTFTAYASAETLARSTLGDLRPGARVNLERALALGDRLGGHLVSGHVDAVAVVDDVRPEGASLRVRLSFAAEHGAEIIPKGSVALDGISLTVNDCGPDWLCVNVIPETARVTTVRDWRGGTRVNLETDILGKYARRLLGPYLPQGGAAQEGSGLTLDFLSEHGFR